MLSTSRILGWYCAIFVSVTKAAIIAIMLFLGLGLTQPSGCMQFCDLKQQYKTCSEEDHDITPLDFLFEHLLNLESIVNLFEGEHEYSGGDQPHLPFHASEFSQTFVALPNTLHFEINDRKSLWGEGTVYFSGNEHIYLSKFCADLLRPPIFS